MTSAAITAVVDHWSRMRGNHLAPTRLAIDPASVAPWLGDVFVLGEADGTLVLRIVGQTLVQRPGWRLGADFYALWEVDWADTWRRLLVHTREGYALSGGGADHEVVLLPLLHPRDAVTRWIGVVSGRSAGPVRLNHLGRMVVPREPREPASRPFLRVVDGGRA